MMVSCEKCSTQSSKDDMVCCKQCGCHYDRKCTEGLCDEAGDWMVPPTEIKQWLCNSCRQSPTHVRCDMCKSIVRETSRYAACGRCGRHVCRRCAALPPPAALRRAPWLCRECEGNVSGVRALRPPRVPALRRAPWLCRECEGNVSGVRALRPPRVPALRRAPWLCRECEGNVSGVRALRPPRVPALRRAPWLCRECEVSVPTGDQLFGYSFAKHPALWKPHATEVTIVVYRRVY
ncbi:zinc finger protein 99-like [Ostrinia nubilalis]|uniref:zinc finger protein 99-like n=1 Tax=Ostrinia nubilalis TaxID=29057 RepID=UPI00308253D3